MMRKITTTLLAMLLTMMVANVHPLSAQTLFHEGFDGGVLPAGWAVVDADGDGYTWDATFQYQENPSDAYMGDGMIASASYINEEGALFPDNWLISPAISIPGNPHLLGERSGCLLFCGELQRVYCHVQHGGRV